MRVRAVMAFVLAALVAGCGGGFDGWLGSSNKPDPASDIPQEITKPIGPHLVARCPVPVAYDDATDKKIQQALDALPKDSVLHKVMQDYELERDNLRLCK